MLNDRGTVHNGTVACSAILAVMGQNSAHTTALTHNDWAMWRRHDGEEGCTDAWRASHSLLHSSRPDVPPGASSFPTEASAPHARLSFPTSKALSTVPVQTSGTNSTKTYGNDGSVC
jgi:hypothetical protein